MSVTLTFGQLLFFQWSHGRSERQDSVQKGGCHRD